MNAKKLVDFIHNNKYALKAIKILSQNFSNIKIAEYYENTFKIKIYKQANESKTIGYVFGTIEDIVTIT